MEETVVQGWLIPFS